MKKFVQSLRNDPLLKSLFLPGRPLDSKGFLLLIPFTIFLIRLLWNLTPAPIIILPLSVWLWYVIVDGRLLHSGRRSRCVSLIIGCIPALATLLCLDLLSLSPLHLGPFMISHTPFITVPLFSKIITLSSVVSLALTGGLTAASLVIIIVLALKPGLGESALPLFKENDSIGPFALTGTLSRERLMLYALAWTALSLLLILVYAVLIILTEGIYGLSDMSWAGGDHSGFLTGAGFLLVLIFVLLKVSLFTLYIRRARSLGISGLWGIPLFLLILVGSGLEPEIIRIGLPFLMSRIGMEWVIFSNIWLAPAIAPVIMILRNAMFLSLAVLYLYPSGKHSIPASENNGAEHKTVPEAGE